MGNNEGNEKYVTKDGTLLLVVDKVGFQLFSMDISGWDMDDPEAIRELGKTVCEGLPNEAYVRVSQ